MAMVYDYHELSDLLDETLVDKGPRNKIKKILAKCYPWNGCGTEVPFDKSLSVNDPTFVISHRKYDGDVVDKFHVHLPNAKIAERIANAIGFLAEVQD